MSTVIRQTINPPNMCARAAILLTVPQTLCVEADDGPTFSRDANFVISPIFFEGISTGSLPSPSSPFLRFFFIFYLKHSLAATVVIYTIHPADYNCNISFAARTRIRTSRGFLSFIHVAPWYSSAISGLAEYGIRTPNNNIPRVCAGRNGLSKVAR